MPILDMPPLGLQQMPTRNGVCLDRSAAVTQLVAAEGYKTHSYEGGQDDELGEESTAALAIARFETEKARRPRNSHLTASIELERNIDEGEPISGGQLVSDPKETALSWKYNTGRRTADRSNAGIIQHTDYKSTYTVQLTVCSNHTISGSKKFN